MIDTVFQGKTGVLGTYMITDDRTALVDPGPPVQAQQTVQELKHQGRKIDTIALTHIHLDHASGTWDILQEYPECTVIVHPRGTRHLIDPTDLLETALAQFKGEMPPYGEIHGIPPAAIMESQDNMIIPLGDTQLQIIWTPGHSTHSQSYYLREDKILFAGDAAGHLIAGHILPASPPPFNPEHSIKSINRMIELKPSLLCIGHFGYAEEAISHLNDIKDRIILWDRLSYETLEEDGGLRDYYNLVNLHDKGIQKLVQTHPETKRNIYGSLAGFLSYAKWKTKQ